jgi:hypothetical protein
MISFSAILACLVGAVVLRVGLSFCDRWAILAGSPLLGSFLLLASAIVCRTEGSRATFLLAILVAHLLAWLRLRGSIASDMQLTKPVGAERVSASSGTAVGTYPAVSGTSGKRKWALPIAAALLGFYACVEQFSAVDSDNWIHEPLIASYIRGVFPPLNPYHPDYEMHGHFGRDLLVAAWSAPLADPLAAVWVLNPLLSVCGFVFLARTLGNDRQRGFWAALWTYFGINCGFRFGLINSLDDNNGVVYAFFVLLTVLCSEIVNLSHKTRAQQLYLAILTGCFLGLYEVVYETHFGLFMLAGITTLLLTARHLKVWINGIVLAAVALGIAAVIGGPVTDLRVRLQAKITGAAPDARTETTESQNLSQSVVIKFPKQEFLQLRLTTAEYQRLSSGFSFPLFAPFRPRVRGEGYISIFDPRFLILHWFPLWLAPWTMWRSWKEYRQSGNTLGIFLCSFGSWAYLMPGLAHFGEIYEWEFYRWELAASAAFAMAMGWQVAPFLGRAWPISKTIDSEGARIWKLSTDYRPQFLAVGLTALCLLPVEKLLNGAWIDFQSGKCRLALSGTRAWRLGQPLFGLCPADFAAIDYLRANGQVGQRILTNLGAETPWGLWPDSNLSTLTGLSPVGRDIHDQFVRTTPFHHRSPRWRAFWSSGKTEILADDKVTWVYADPSLVESVVRTDLEKDSSLVRFGEGKQQRWLWKLSPTQVKAGEPLEISKLELSEKPQQLRTSKVYAVTATVEKAPAADTLVYSQVSSLNSSLKEPRVSMLWKAGQQTQQILAVTSIQEGPFALEVGSVAKGTSRDLSIVVDFRERLSKIKAVAELPGDFQTRKFINLKVTVSSPSDLKSEGELEIAYRFKSTGGDYYWQLDSIWQPVNLDLKSGATQELWLPVLTPAEAGGYQLELELRERSSGSKFPVYQSPVLNVAMP